MFVLDIQSALMIIVMLKCNRKIQSSALYCPTNNGLHILMQVLMLPTILTWKLVQFCFAICAHSGNVSHIVWLMQSQWTREKNKLSAEPVLKIWTVQFNFKNVSFEKYLTHISGIHAVLKNIRWSEENAGAYIWQRVMWRVSYKYHYCFKESKHLLQNFLCVAPANVVTLSLDVAADAGLLCNRVPCSGTWRKKHYLYYLYVHHSLGFSRDSLTSSSEKGFQPPKVDLYKIKWKQGQLWCVQQNSKGVLYRIYIGDTVMMWGRNALCLSLQDMYQKQFSLNASAVTGKISKVAFWKCLCLNLQYTFWLSEKLWYS